jgi:PII-like signaling protein
MTLEGEALLVRIYIGESDHWEGRPLYDAIVRHLRERGIRGVSVFRGIEGYGRSSRVHTTRILALSEDLPILVEAVDETERVRAVLGELEPMIGGGLVTLERVEVVVYRSANKG